MVLNGFKYCKYGMHTCILWTTTNCKRMPLVFCYGRDVEKNVITRSEVEHLWSCDHQMSNLTVQKEYNVNQKELTKLSSMTALAWIWLVQNFNSEIQLIFA